MILGPMDHGTETQAYLRSESSPPSRTQHTVPMQFGRLRGRRWRVLAAWETNDLPGWPHARWQHTDWSQRHAVSRSWLAIWWIGRHTWVPGGQLCLPGSDGSPTVASVMWSVPSLHVESRQWAAPRAALWRLAWAIPTGLVAVVTGLAIDLT